MSDDSYALNAKRSAYRDGFNSADLELVMSVFADAVTTFAAGYPSFYGSEGREAVCARTQAMLDRYRVELTTITARWEIYGDFAVEYGWQHYRLLGKSDGTAQEFNLRYMANWKHFGERGWLIVRTIDNVDCEPMLLDDQIEHLKKHGPRVPR